MRATWIAIVGLSALAGCSVLELERQTEAFNASPAIYGELVPENWSGEPMVLILSGETQPGAPYTVEYFVQHDPGPFYVYVEPGRYQLAVFEDRSGKLEYRPGDPALAHPETLLAERGEGARLEVRVADRLSTATRLPGRFDIAHDSAQTKVSIAHRNVGRVVTLDAREMSLELGQAGMWDPLRYLKELQIGLFLLEPFDPRKTPVLFVHGIGGAPVQFEKMATALDRERFQPWFFAYPSIFPLQMIGEALSTCLDIMRRRNEFDHILLIAHSMGGLVSRAYLNEYSWTRHDYDVALFTSLASPFGGESGAAMYPGQNRGEAGPFDTWIANTKPQQDEYAHIAWTDMAPGSPFLVNLYAEPLPENLVYTLVFAFRPDQKLGTASDGVVTLASQLRPEAQREASHERGFPMGHDDVLIEPDAIEYVLARLEEAHERVGR